MSTALRRALMLGALIVVALVPAAPASATVDLTAAESTYLEDRGPIVYPHLPSGPPFEFTDERGQAVGIAVDLRRLMEVRYGLTFEVVDGLNTSNAVASMLGGSGDVAGWLSYTPERDASLQFTEPYALAETFAWGKTGSLAAREDGFAGATIAVPSGTLIPALAAKAFPNATLVNVSGNVAGLDLVRADGALAYVGLLPSLAYESRRTGSYDELGPLGAPLQTVEIGFSVRGDDPILFSILAKALASISAAERSAIFIKWTGRDIAPVQVGESGVPLRTIAIGGAVAIVAVSAVGIPTWIVTLRRRVDQRTREVKELNDTLEMRVAERTHDLNEALTDLESLTNSVHHDLRTPLRAIDGFSQALLNDHKTKLDAEGREDLERVRAATRRMAELIDGALELTKLGRRELRSEPVSLSALAREITDQLRSKEPKRDATFIVQPGIEARGDPALLHALLTHLLGNAWKFTSRHDHATIEFGAMQRPEGVTYFVRDDGAGFDPRYADKLFGAFQRLHHANEFPGHGLGLASVRRIVARHGGNAWAEGGVEEGATFYFTLARRTEMT